MAQIKKESRVGRPPAGDVAKKVVSLTIDPALVKQVDEYAADKRMSRSAIIEAAVVGFLALNASSPMATMENSQVQPDCVFASPSLGVAILY